MPLRCLGIDPGLGKLGFGLVAQRDSTLTAETYGCLETPPGEALHQRLLRLFSDLDDVMGRTAPDVVAVEKLFFGRNATTAEMVWQARGVVLLLVARRGIPLQEVTPNEVKMGVTGFGNATKGQVQGMVQKILSLESPPRPDDAADALGIAMAGMALYRYAALAERRHPGSSTTHKRIWND